MAVCEYKTAHSAATAVAALHNLVICGRTISAQLANETLSVTQAVGMEGAPPEPTHMLELRQVHVYE